MRAIIRVSVNGEQDGRLRNALAKILTDKGFALTNATATYENANITPADFFATMALFWAQAANPANITGVTHGAALDHAWVYVD